MIISLHNNLRNNFRRFTCFSGLLLAVIFGFFPNNKAQAQVATGYQFSQDLPGVYTPITGGTVYGTGTFNATVGVTNPAAVAAPIGFTFNYNGTNYTNCSVSRGGYITFGTLLPVTPFGQPISSGTAFDGLISGMSAPNGLWSANQSGSYGAGFVSEIRYETAGASPNRVFTIQYKNMIRRSGIGTPNGLLNFQIKIYETTNKIEIIDDAVPTAPLIGSAGANNAQIGIRGINNTDYNIRTGVWNGPTTTSGGTNIIGMTLSSTVNNYPTVTNRFTYSPCYQVRALTATQIPNSVISWTAPAMSDGTTLTYDYEIRTSGAFGSGASGLVTAGNTAATTFTASSLTPGIPYTFYVRTNPNCGGAPVSIIITPVCNPQAIPYTQNFESALVPVLPPCSATINNSGNSFTTAYTNPVAPPLTAGGFTGNYTTVVTGPDSWFITEGITVPAGNYKLTYTYGGDRSQNFFVQQMRVFIGTAQAAAAGANNMTGGILLDTHPSIKSSPNAGDVTFNIPTGGTYYLGFQAYNVAGNGALNLDDIVLTPATCLPVSNIVAQNVTATSADLSWTGSATMDDGYIIFVSGTGQVPANNNYTGSYFTSATNFALNGLSGSTAYCVWIRTVCDGGLTYGAWTPLATPASGCFTTLVAPPAYCIPASSSSASFFSNFTTSGGASNINNTTGYSAGGYGNYSAQVVSQSPGSAISFTATIPSGGHNIGIWVDWNNDGVFTSTAPVELMFSGSQLGASPVPSGSFSVPAGQAVGNYRMRILMDFSVGTSVPCSFIGTRGEAEDYTFKVIVPPPALTLSSYSSTQCGNVATGLVTITTPLSNFGNNSNYTMSPTTGVTGNPTAGYTFTSALSQVYTLTGTQTVSPYSVNSVRYVYTANSTPTPITITPASTAVCANGPAKLLTANGGQVSGLNIIDEKFDDPTIPVGWVTASDPVLHNTGAVASSLWILRPDGYNPGGSSGISSVRSNDLSQFYLSNSDSQGSGGNTYVTLTSKIFSLGLPAVYSAANFSFWHYYKAWINGSARVEISNDGTTWTLIESWGNSSAAGSNQGLATQFVNPSVAPAPNTGNYNLASYIGMTNLRIRFTYQATWGYVWAIDNFKVTVSTANSTTWAPTAGLFTDAAATTPYAGQITNTVYALPTAATTYTATAVTPAPVCSSSKSVNVTITPIVKGTVSADQFTCTGLQSSLSAMSVSGLAAGNSVLRWEYSDSPTFTPSTPCTISNSLTLATFKMGTFPLTQDRYIRAVIVNGSCTIFSDPVKITFSRTVTNDGITWTNGGPTSTKAVVFDGPGTYNVAGNISACSVTVLNGAVATITGVLTVENNLNTTAGTLKFDDNASLLQTSTAANTTPITYLRKSTPMQVYDFTHWSSPVAGQVLNLFSPNTLPDKFLIWDTSVANPNWSSVAGSSSMTVGRGYIIRSELLAGATGTLIHSNPFIGVPNNGNLSVNIQISGAAGVNNWNLIGNPYPSGLNADLFLGTNNSKINGTIYFWTHNTAVTNYQYNNNNDFASYNLSGGIGTASTVPGVSQNKVPTGIIASGQAFFVSVLPAVQTSAPTLATSSVNFTNAMRVGAGNNVFFRNNNDNNVAQNTSPGLEKNRIWLDITNAQGAFCEMLYGNIETATNGFDQMFDGKWSNNNNTASLYSMLGTDRLSIKGNGLPYSVTDTNDLGYKATVAGNFQIKLSNFDGLFVNENIYLEDKLLNVIHDLKQSDYDFTTQTGIFNDRFVLRFTNTTLANSKTIFNENTVFVYKSNTDIHINTSNIEMKSIAVYDINGRTIYNNNNVSGSQFVISNLNVAQQVLIVKVTATDGKIVNKKIVF